MSKNVQSASLEDKIRDRPESFDDYDCQPDRPPSHSVYGSDLMPDHVKANIDARNAAKAAKAAAG
jgi:hypothetical protein